MSIAIMFPGQGSQRVGMGKELSDNFSCAREVFSEIDTALGQNLSQIIFNGPAAELTLTHNAQPSIMAVSIAAFRVAQEKYGKNLSDKISFALGHSLGEYSALVVCGALSLADCAVLLRQRGQAMQESADVKPMMAAIIGLRREDVYELVKPYPDCALANDNSPQQAVISGGAQNISKICETAKMKSAKKIIPLSVSAAFHSPLMANAQEIMKPKLQDVKMRKFRFPIISNVTAKPVSDAEEEKKLLAKQITHTVRWQESVNYLYRHLKVKKMVEFGPSNVLASITKRNFPKGVLDIESAFDEDSIEKTIRLWD